MTNTTDREFADRFLQGLDRAAGVPAMQHGRLTWLARQLESKFGAKVAAETTRKWSKGLIKPREQNMRMLSEIFGVDMIWLQTGEGPISTKSEKRLSGRRATGAVHFVAGAMMMTGKQIAFPREDDAVARDMFIDLYAIKHGEQRTISVCDLIDEGGGKMLSNIPFPLRASDVILVHPTDDQIKVYVLYPDIVEKSAEHVNGHLEIKAELGKNNDLIIGDIRISNTPTMANF